MVHATVAIENPADGSVLWPENMGQKAVLPLEPILSLATSFWNLEPDPGSLLGTETSGNN